MFLLRFLAVSSSKACPDSIVIIIIIFFSSYIIKIFLFRSPSEYFNLKKMPIVQPSLFDRIASEGVHFALWSSIMSVGGGLGEIFVNHDARMHISGEHALPELIEAHKRSKVLTNLMLLVSGISGGLAYQQTKDTYWLIGSGLMLGKSNNKMRREKKYLCF